MLSLFNPYVSIVDDSTNNNISLVNGEGYNVKNSVNGSSVIAHATEQITIVKEEIIK